MALYNINCFKTILMQLQEWFVTAKLDHHIQYWSSSPKAPTGIINWQALENVTCISNINTFQS